MNESKFDPIERVKTDSSLSLRGRVLTTAGVSGVPEAALARRLHNKQRH